MKVRKTKILLTAIGMSSMLMSNMPVEASEGLVSGYEEEIMPQYVKSFDVQTTLSISGGKAKCIGRVSGKTGDKCSLTTTLQKNSGSGWTNVKTWKSSGVKNCSTSGSVSVTKGVKYRLKAVGKSGTESETKYSATKSY